MTRENRQVAIARELGHADSALRAAHALRSLGLRNDAISRLYYALYHSVVALLLIEGVEPRRHGALAGLLGQHVVGRHELSASDVGVISRTFALRGLADYERTWDADEELTGRTFDEVEPVIARIHAYLHGSGWTDPSS